MRALLRRIGRVACRHLVVALATAGLGGAAMAQKSAVLRMSVVPNESPTEIARKFEPLVRYLARELDTRVEWVPLADYDAVVAAMVQRRIDLAVLGGFTFVQANTRSGGKIVPLVHRDTDANIRSVFVTRAGSGIERLEDLKGRSFSFGPPSSTSGHLMPRVHLLAAKIDPEVDLRGIFHSAAHDATVAAVVSRKADAGALNIRIWERLVAGRKVDASQVKVFFTTPPYHDASWSVHADLPVATRAAIKAAFLKLNASTPEGKEILELQAARRYLPTRVENYDAIKAAAENAGLPR